jgi:hypothetical protein
VVFGRLRVEGCGGAHEEPEGAGPPVGVGFDDGSFGVGVVVSCGVGADCPAEVHDGVSGSALAGGVSAGEEVDDGRGCVAGGYCGSEAQSGVIDSLAGDPKGEGELVDGGAVWIFGHQVEH